MADNSQNQMFDPTALARSVGRILCECCHCHGHALAGNAKETTNTRPQHEETFNDFEELSRLCVLGGEQSAMCLLRGAWLQEKREEVRNGAPFVLPSRNKLPREAVYSGRIAEDSTSIIVLSYCWAV